MMNKFEIFEKEVIENILKISDNEFASKILEQYKNSTILNRVFTGVGFYTYFQLNDKSLLLGNDVNLRFWNIHAEINGLKHGAGFMLEIINGVVSNLEGYSYGDDGWPKKVKKYKLFSVNKDGSLTEI